MSERRKFLSMGDWYAAKSAGIDPGRRPVPEQFNKSTPGVLPAPCARPLPGDLQPVRPGREREGSEPRG